MVNMYVSFGVMLVAVVCGLVMIANRDDPTPIGWATIVATGAVVVQFINLRGYF